MKYATEIIGDEYREWQGGDVAFLTLQPGAGKTTFALDELLPYVVEQGKKMAILVPRLILKEQLEEELLQRKSQKPLLSERISQSVVIVTYQQLLPSIGNSGSCFIAEYDFIFCDEAHWLIEDASYNADTGAFYQFLCSLDDKILIFCSGTMGKLHELIVKDFALNKKFEIQPDEGGKGGYTATFKYGRTEYFYEVEPNYDAYTVRYFRNFEEMIRVLKDSKGKSMVFVSSIAKGEKILEELKKQKISSIFINANNKEDTQVAEEVKKLTRYQQFEKNVLIATSVLDVGVSIVDSEVTNIVLMTYSQSSFIQMLDRIRLQDGERLNLFIPQGNLTEVAGRINMEREALDFYKTIDFHVSRGEEISVEKLLSRDEVRGDSVKKYFFRFNNSLILNQFTRITCMDLYFGLTELAKELKKDENAFIKLQLAWLGREEEFSYSHFVEKEYYKEKLEQLRQKIFAIIELYPGKLGLVELQEVLSKIQPLLHAWDRDLIRSNTSLSWMKYNKFSRIYNFGVYVECDDSKRINEYWFQKEDGIVLGDEGKKE